MKGVAVLFSGAKDSAFAIYKAMNMGFKVKFLVTLVPENKESYMFHHPNVQWTTLQSEAMEIPLIKRETMGEKENELEDLRDVLESIKDEIDGVVSGALDSRYQRTRIDDICRDLGLESISPHWGRETGVYLEELINAGFEVIITSVAAEGLGEEWLGRRLDHEALKDLAKLQKKYGIHRGGEGGEYESFVLDCPIFRKKIRVISARKEWDGVSGHYVIENAELVDKTVIRQPDQEPH